MIASSNSQDGLDEKTQMKAEVRRCRPLGCLAGFWRQRLLSCWRSVVEYLESWGRANRVVLLIYACPVSPEYK
jgi:hypothetical protein